MMTWKKGKTFKKNGKTVRYLYKDGKKSAKKLVTVKAPAKKKTYRRR
jgi:hypothetical protein